MYRVRVLHNNYKETIHDGLNYVEALDQFKFYCDATLEFNLDVRCINLFNGKKCIKMLSNH